MSRLKRPMVVEAWMNHQRTPFVTERLSNGKRRQIGRTQAFGPNGWDIELAKLLSTYGKRWTGIRN